MSLKHPENFVEFGTLTKTNRISSSRLEDIRKAIERANTPEAVNDLRARRKAAELMKLLEQADTDFQNERFEAALDGYQKLSRQILGLMEPETEWHVLPAEWPSNAETFQATTQATADLVSQLTPQQQEVSAVLPDEDVAIKEMIQTPLEPVVTYAKDIDASAERTIKKASTAAGQGRWKKAAEFYKNALNNISDDQKRADTLLNLGAMEVQMKRSDQALEHLNEAKEIYEEIGDQVGVAEVAHNSGLAHLKMGDGENAVATLREARNIANKAGLHNLPIPESDSENGSNGNASSNPNNPPVNTGGNLNVPLEPNLPELENIPTPISSDLPEGLGSAINPSLQPDGSEETAKLGSNDLTLRLRSIEKGNAVSNIKLETPALESKGDYKKMLHLPIGKNAKKVTWPNHERLNPDVFIDAWEQRVNAESLDDIEIDLDTPAAFLSNLSHLYHLTLPVKMADCHHELGNYQKAENEYLRAADYKMVNASLEGADLWRRLSENIVAWGDNLYRNQKADDALSIYKKLMTSEGETADSYLYNVESLKPTGEKVAEWLEAVADEETTPDLNPAIEQVLQTVRRRWTYLEAGLDFFGDIRTLVPPFTFSYLQEVARYFANRAIQAEKRYINFFNRFEKEQMTRRQLENSVEQADMNVDAARQHEEAARESKEASQASVDLANTRHDTAQELLNKFEDVDYELEWISGQIARGNAFHGGDQPNLDYGGPGYEFDDDRHAVLQKLTQRKTRISNSLQKKRMRNSVEKADAARDVAREQKDVAEARHRAAVIEREAAEQRAEHAREMSEAFKEQKFTPRQWFYMARLMKYLAEEAMDRAIRAAKLMQRAYNFEQMTDRDTIRNNYEQSLTQGMLGGEVLLSDIDSFTLDKVTSVKQKPIPVKWSISLSEQFPGQFLGFSRTGKMEFDIDLERIRLAHPGTYRHQLKGVEVEADGFLPPFGLHGRLTNSGIGRFRDRSGDDEMRIQPAETMILSRYDRRRDSIILSPPRDMRALFEDNALSSGWTLEVPPSANDVDLNAIFDIRLVLYFECLYDEQLFNKDTEFQSTQSGVDFERSRSFYLRHHFPDAYYQLREDGKASIELSAGNFPHNQTKPELQELSLAFSSKDNSSLEGTELHVNYPGHSEAVDVTINEKNLVPPADFPVNNAPSALGSYTLEIDESQLDRKDQLEDLILVMDYRFTPASK